MQTHTTKEQLKNTDMNLQQEAIKIIAEIIGEEIKPEPKEVQEPEPLQIS